MHLLTKATTSCFHASDKAAQQPYVWIAAAEKEAAFPFELTSRRNSTSIGTASTSANTHAYTRTRTRTCNKVSHLYSASAATPTTTREK